MSRCRFFHIAVITALMPCFCQADLITEVSADNPIAWWRFEDASSTNGSIASDSAGSFNGIYNGQILLQTGIAGQAARFDGNLDSISIGSLGALPTQGTIEMWLKPEAVEDFRNPFTTGPLGGSSTGNRAIRFESRDTGILNVHIGNDTATTSPQFNETIDSSITSNEWHHLVLTWDTGAQTVSAYFDNQQVLNEVSNTFFPSTLSDVRIGLGWANDAGRSWLGSIDEVAIYETQLTSERVAAHFNATSVPEPSSFALLILSGCFMALRRRWTLLRRAGSGTECE